MKFINKSKKIKELEEYIVKVERECDTARIEKSKYREKYNNLAKIVDDNILKMKKLKEQNKLLRQRDKKLKQIELLFENGKVNLKQLTKIVMEED